MFPSKETIDVFLAMCAKDGLMKVSSSIFEDKVDPKYEPTIQILKNLVVTLTEMEKALFDPESFATGFLTCFNIFRLQLESEDMTIEDMSANMAVLNSYVEFLENENSELRNGKSSNGNK